MNDIFKKIFESGHIAQIVIDINSTIRYANHYAEMLFGYEENELIGKDIEMLVPTESKAKHPDLVKSYFEAPLPRKMGRGRRLFGLKKNGKKFAVEVGLSPIETDDGLLVMSSIIDFTHQLTAEEQFKSVVESAPNGMLMINTSGTIVLVNKQIEKMFEYPREKLLGSQIEIIVPDEFKEHHPKFVQSFIRNPEPRSMGIGRELFGRKSNGGLFPVEIGLQPLVEKDGSILILASVVDITKRREAEKLIEEKSEELQEFAYRTSHDLKSPLTTIISMIQYVKSDLTAGHVNEVEKSIDKIEQISRNLKSLVETLLFLTKADLSDDRPLKFDFKSFLENLQLSYTSQLEKAGVKIETSLNHAKDLIIQPTRLNQILENLVSNSIKFVNELESDKKIKILTYNDTQFFYIQVSDNGIGIPKEKQEEVFSMFKRFHDDIKGHGIGLYMVKKFVTKMKGEITFDSGKHGTCFYLKFPFTSETEDKV